MVWTKLGLGLEWILWQWLGMEWAWYLVLKKADWRAGHWAAYWAGHWAGHWAAYWAAPKDLCLAVLLVEQTADGWDCHWAAHWVPHSAEWKEQPMAGKLADNSESQKVEMMAGCSVVESAWRWAAGWDVQKAEPMAAVMAESWVEHWDATKVGR